MKLSNALYPIVTVLAIVILVFLYDKTQLLDIEPHNQVIKTLGELKQLDAALTESVLLSRVALNNNYDDLTAISKTLAEASNRLLNFDMKAIYGDRAKTGQKPIDAYQLKLTNKRDLIEQFKAVNAVLSNSVRYFPLSITELFEMEEEFPGLDLQSLKNLANQLLAEVLKYSLTPSDATQAQILKLATALQMAGNQYKHEDLDEQIDVIHSHARAVLKYQPETDRVLEKIAVLSATKEINVILETYMSLYNTNLQDRNKYRITLIGFSALLLLWVAYIGYRLRLSYKSLDIANHQLQTANDTLEKRVEERTEELSNTLHSLKESQSQLIQSEKMASLGQMVAGVTHEMNTPLGYIKSNVQLMQSMYVETKQLMLDHQKLVTYLTSETTSEEELESQLALVVELDHDLTENETLQTTEDLLTDSLHGLEQISELVLSLKNFSRLDLAKVSDVDLHECLDSSLVIANNVLKNKVTIEKHYGDIPKIKCSPSQINQVFLNLLTNAADAIETQGTLRITTSIDNEQVQVMMQDDGAGIPQAVLPKIFDPFFTTKEIGKGMGLGLSISYQIIQQHGGDIKFTSEEGKGTTCVVSLPTILPK